MIGFSHKRNFLLFFAVIGLVPLMAFFISCQESPKKNSQVDASPQASSMLIKYAKGFSINEYPDGSWLVEVFYPNTEGQVLFSCILSPSGTANTKAENQLALVVPLDSVAVFSATQLAGMAQLGQLNKVVGVSESKYITNSQLRDQLDKGSTVELGNNGAFFVERTLALKPKAIFYSPYQFNQAHPLAASSRVMIPFLDFMETDPLGRAEWIKFSAIFMGNYPEADSIFEKIVQEYNQLKVLVQGMTSPPTMMSDKYFADQWYVPGGLSYVAAILQDAGASYIWKDNLQVASVPMEIESVLSQASKANYWRIVGAYEDGFSYEKLATENELYKQFSAFKNHKIIFCDSRKTGYFEQGALEPHVQLADLIYALHPELLPNYVPTYYKLMP